MRPSQSFIVERRTLPPRYAARVNDREQLQVVIATMRDVPRESTASFADMFHLLRRLAGALDRIAGDLQAVEPTPVRLPRRSHVADRRQVADAVFKSKTLPVPMRAQALEIGSSRGRRVRMVSRRVTGQMESRL